MIPQLSEIVKGYAKVSPIIHIKKEDRNFMPEIVKNLLIGILLLTNCSDFSIIY